MQWRRHTIEREAEDRGVKAALDARRRDEIRRAGAIESARQMMQQPPGYVCIVDLMHRLLVLHLPRPIPV